MEDTTNQNQIPSLTPLQEKVAEALACGATITGAAEETGLLRVTIYRWIKTMPAFVASVRRNRAEFAISRRDDLHYLANRAIETLLAILDNPRTSQAVHLRTSMFILQQNQKAGKAWFLPEPLPELDADPGQDIALLPGDIEDSAQQCKMVQNGAESDGESASDESCEAPYCDGILPSCPVPSEILNRRDFRRHIEDTMDDLRTIRHEEFNPERDDPKES